MNMRNLTLVAVLGIAAVVSVSAETQKVQIQGAVGKLAAVITKPKIAKGAKVPMVILMHGFMGSKDEDMWVKIASSLQDKGYASIRFDFNGHGESEGAFENMTVLNEIDDAKCVYDYVSKLPYVSDISAVGHSQGGVVASMFAGDLGKDKLAKLVLLAPAAVLREDAIRGSIMGATFNSLNPPDTVHLYGKYSIGKEYIKTARSLQIFETARKYRGPVCLIHGTGDVVAPYSYSERYQSIYNGATLFLLPAFDHMFSQGLNQVIDATVEFLTE